MNASTYVPPKGRPNSTYVIVGEQPGRNEVRYGEPFVGLSGQNLQQCLLQAGIQWTDCYRTNVIKDLDHSLDHYIKFVKGRIPRGIFTAAGEEYLESLKYELAQTTANIIIACGGVALWALCSRVGITAWRGSVLDSTLIPGRKVIPTFHPATWTPEKLYDNPSAYLNKHIVTFDLIRAKKESEYPEIRRIDRTLHTEPTFYEAMEYLHTCHTKGLEGNVITYDIELQPKTHELSCIGISWNSSEAMCIPFTDARGDYFSPDEEARLMSSFDGIFSDPTIKKRGQNVIFDAHLVLNNYGIRTHNLEDTMVAQGVLYPEFRKGLDFITSIWTDIPYYKKDGKIWLEGGNEWTRGWEYNCYDVIACAAAHEMQEAELIDQGNYETYQRQVRLIEPLTYMMAHGIRVDKAGMERAYREGENEIERLTSEISTLIGRTINLNSAPQLCDYFYNEKGVKPYVNPDTGAPTVDVTALTRLSIKGFTEAKLILELRQTQKRMSTFLDTSKIDADGRIRCSYNPVGTKYGRISSSSNIFGTGTNLQNVPHDVLEHFLPDEECVLYSMDMSQIENRIVAAVGNIRPMIEAFERGIDVHRVTAALVLTMLGIPTTVDEVTPEQRQEKGKQPNHAFNYGYGYRSFALRYGIPEREAKRIHSAYHNAYPGLKNGYWKGVEDQLRSTRFLTTLYGRKIPFFGKWSETLLHEAYSAIPQSTCGDLVNDRGICFTYYNEDPDFETVELLTQIHDSIEFQIPLSTPIDIHARVIGKIRDSLEHPLHTPNYSFSVPVDLTVGKCMKKKLGVEIKNTGLRCTHNELVQKLQKAHEKLGLDCLPF